MKAGKATCWPSNTVTTTMPISQAKKLNVRVNSTDRAPAQIAASGPAGASRIVRQSTYTAKAASSSVGMLNASGNNRTVGGHVNATAIA